MAVAVREIVGRRDGLGPRSDDVALVPKFSALRAHPGARRADTAEAYPAALATTAARHAEIEQRAERHVAGDPASNRCRAAPAQLTTGSTTMT